MTFRFLYTAPPTLSPAAVKKLIEKRNGLFQQAVDEYGKATGFRRLTNNLREKVVTCHGTP